MDLHDLENNTRDGVHIASLAGTWVALVAGFGGLRHLGNQICFAPRLPGGLSRLAFTVVLRGQRLRVTVTAARARYLLEGGDLREIMHHGRAVTLQAGQPKVLPIPEAPASPRPAQPHGRAPIARRAEHAT
jgi:alpha,alpha-trehalose phosphorylase